MTIRNADIYRMTDAYRAAHPDLARSGDGLQPYLDGDLHADWHTRRFWAYFTAGYVGTGAVIVVLVLAVIWAVT